MDHPHPVVAGQQLGGVNDKQSSSSSKSAPAAKKLALGAMLTAKQAGAKDGGGKAVAPAPAFAPLAILEAGPAKPKSWKEMLQTAVVAALSDPFWVSFNLFIGFCIGAIVTSPLVLPHSVGCSAADLFELDGLMIHHDREVAHGAYRPGDYELFMGGVALGALLIQVRGVLLPKG